MYNYAMSTTIMRRVVSITILLFSTILLVWGLWPLPKQGRSLVINLTPSVEVLEGMDLTSAVLDGVANGASKHLLGGNETRILDWNGRIRFTQVMLLRSP